MPHPFTLTISYDDRTFTDEFTCREIASDAIADLVLELNGVHTSRATDRRKHYAKLRGGSQKLGLYIVTTHYKNNDNIPALANRVNSMLNEIRTYFPMVTITLRISEEPSKWRGMVITLAADIVGDFTAYHCWWWVTFVLRSVAAGYSGDTIEELADEAYYGDVVDAWMAMRTLSKRSVIPMLVKGQGPVDLYTGVDPWSS